MNRFPRSRRARGALGSVAAAALVAGLLTLGAAPASAVDVNPDYRIDDTLTLSPTSGTLDASDGLGGPSSVTSTVGCPEGFRAGGRGLLFGESENPGVAAGFRRTVATAGYGLDGNPLALTGAFASVFNNISYTAWRDGANTLVYTCDSVRTSASNIVVDETSRYFSIVLYADKTLNRWTLEPVVAPEKTTPTIAYSGATANANGSVTLTAAVSGASGAATDATGTVAFSGTYAGLAAPVTNDATLADGVATWTTPVLDAGKSYTFSAGYRANGDAKYNDSAADATATVTTVAEPAAPQDTDITVTIPASAIGLKFTITPGDVALGKPTLEGTSYVATGALGNVKITDSRADRTAWSLNGKAGDFVGTADATRTIAASSLGWAPELVGATQAGTAGAAVAAGENGGLSSDRALASAPAAVTAAETTVKATITMKAPSDSAAGTYKAKLTLTLI